MRVWPALLLLLSDPANAAPSVFVQSSPNRAFWNSEKNVGRVLEKQAGPITAKTLNKFIADDRAFEPYEICSLSAASREAYVGVDKAIASEMALYDQQGATVYRVSATTPDGRP